MDLHHQSIGYESIALLLSYVGILAFLLCSNEEGSGGRITSQHQELIVLIRSPVIKPAGGLYTLTDSNRPHPPCRDGVLTTELSGLIVKMEPNPGLEPGTRCLRCNSSTVELVRHKVVSVGRLELPTSTLSE